MKNSFNLYRRLLKVTTKEKIKKGDLKDLNCFDFGDHVNFGDGCELGRFCTIGSDATIGRRATIGHRATIITIIKNGNLYNYYMSFQNLDGSGRQIHILEKDGVYYFYAGCFFGTAQEFAEKAESENKSKYVEFAKKFL